MVAGRGIVRNYGRNNNSPATGSFPPPVVRENSVRLQNQQDTGRLCHIATRMNSGTDAPWVFSGGRRPQLLRRTGLALGRVLQMATPWLAHARRNPSYSLRLLFCRSRFV